MSDPPSKTSSGFNFGQPASTSNATAQPNGQLGTGSSTSTSNSQFGSTPGTTSLFGGSQASGGFGATSQGGSSSIFGGASSTGGGFSFANNQNTAKEAVSPFGTFGTPSKTTTPENTSKAPTTSLFGNLSSSTTTAPTGSITPGTTKAPLSLFGSGSTTPAGPPPVAPSGSLFNLPSSQSSGGASLFSGIGAAKSSASEQPSQTSGASSNIFGNLSQNTPTTTAQTQSTSKPLFGNVTTGSTTSLFSNLSKTGEKKTTDAPNQSASTPTTTNDTSKQGLQFPSTLSASSQATSQPTGTSSTVSPFNFAPKSTTTTQATSTSGAMAASTEAPKLNLFGNTQQSASSSSVFPSLGQQKDATVTQSTSQPATTATGLGAASTSAQSSSPFNLAGGGAGNASQAPSISSAAPVTTAPTAPSATTALGSSNSGPVPGTQSRLKNKSMDEIITRWASDLSKYQKEFQAQAEKVASWDRMLVDNSGKISKLYSKTFQAERDMAEVERQLSTVEGQQDELSMYLDRYEKEVDEMMSRQVGQGEGLQGPDQERERTYKTAEKVSERLNEMGKDLTSMIEEINAASAAISKSNKPNDPLSQIVRVLNSHLSQLQIIDQGAAELQAKAHAAQKESQRLSSSRPDGLRNDAADDFYRSYKSRR